MLETIKTIGSIIGYTLSLITLLSLCSKRIRNQLVLFFKEFNEKNEKSNQTQDEEIKEIKELIEKINNKLTIMESDNEIMKEFTKQQCKEHIKNVFYKYRDTKKIPYYEWQCADAAYQVYHNKLHENHDTACLYEQISKWEIDCSEKIDL